jgi:DNA invertase Pin-like site-specific DNA recombinase
LKQGQAMASQDKHVAYYRVSTDRQGKSGLGLEAQRAAVVPYLNGGDWQIVGNFSETESGKRSDRPELDKALAAARLHRCPLVVSKVDRLTRSVAFLSRLLELALMFGSLIFRRTKALQAGFCCSKWLQWQSLKLTSIWLG